VDLTAGENIYWPGEEAGLVLLEDSISLFLNELPKDRIAHFVSLPRGISGRYSHFQCVIPLAIDPLKNMAHRTYQCHSRDPKNAERIGLSFALEQPKCVATVCKNVSRFEHHCASFSESKTATALF
jgi:hypothetical protein